MTKYIVIGLLALGLFCSACSGSGGDGDTPPATRTPTAAESPMSGETPSSMESPAEEGDMPEEEGTSSEG